MALPPEANGHPPELPKDSKETPGASAHAERPQVPTNPSGSAKSPEQKSRPPKPKQKRPNYNLIHANPLPLTTHPLPAFHPSNPISLLRLYYIYLTHLFSPPSSHPPDLITGLFSPRTRSIHVTDSEAVRRLWEMGFWGKGTLSRSEPGWVERERVRLRDGGGGGAEAATRKRREERRVFKLERARLERERIERQRAVEEGRLEAEERIEGGGEEVLKTGEVREDDVRTLVGSQDASFEKANGHVEGKGLHEGRVPDADVLQAPDSTTQTPSKNQPAPTTPTQAPPTTSSAPKTQPDPDGDEPDIPNEEHLQLTLEEAFFLTYGLGLLTIFPPPPSLNPAPHHPGPTPYTNADMLFLSCHHSAFPPIDSGSGIAPDDQFLLNYVTYHHFRSLGWVVRPGVKFGVDYLLYNRGPVFSHAEFAVLIVPSYTHRYWNTPGGRSRRRIHYPNETSGFSNLEVDGGDGGDVSGGDGKDWYWLHCVNRVQSQVRKTLVLCYVDIPSPWEVGLDDEWDTEVDVGRLLRGYRVREFVVRRWVPNRSRD